LFAGGEHLNDFGEDLVAITAVEGKGELRGEEAVLDADVEALTPVDHGEVLLALGEKSKSRGEAGAFLGCVRKKAGDDAEDSGGEYVHAVEAEVLTTAEPGNDEALFGFSGRGLFENGVDAIEAGFSRHRLAAYGAEVGEEILARDLHGGDGASGGSGGVDEAFGGAAGFRADVDVVADEVKEGLVANEVARTEDGVSVTAGIALGNEGEADGVFDDELGVGFFIPG